MLSNRPYLLRAFFQWIIDSACTPILVIDTNHPKCKVPKEYVEDGEIVFNISPTAVRDLKMDNDVVEFKASFSGVIHLISAPVKAILAVYAEENGEGIFFDAEEDTDSGKAGSAVVQLKEVEGSNFVPSSQEASSTTTAKSKPVLKLVE